MKKYILITLFNVFHLVLIAQEKTDIIFTAKIKKCRQDSIVIEVKNISQKTFYYYIGVEGLTDTGYVSLLSDIKSIGQNGFIKLTSIKPKAKFSQIISRKRIVRMCNCRIRKLRFYISYFISHSFESQNRVIRLTPM
ncbi:MAG: hypothetical protein H0W75_03820 [Chitinophagaceae bacterium]|nr:hypothetical protein [Chitinophagaceae bacterium]